MFQKELFYVTDTAIQLRLLGFELPTVIGCLIDKREQIRLNVKAIDELVKDYNEALNKMDDSVVSKFRLCLELYYTFGRKTYRPLWLIYRTPSESTF